MVNLKDYLLQATADETRFPELIASVRKYLARDDAEFCERFAAAVRDAIREKAVSARQKYLCLQAVNVGMQTRSRPLAEAVERKLLERLFLMAMLESKVGDAEQRGRALLRQFDENADENDSADFYALLIECFAVWAREALTPAFAAKHATLAKSAPTPTAFKHVSLYVESPPRLEEALRELEAVAADATRGAETRAAALLAELRTAVGDSQCAAAVRARKVLSQLDAGDGELLPRLPKAVGAPANPFLASAEAASPTPKPPSHDDVQTILTYVQSERAAFARTLAALKEENANLAAERRQLETRIAALESELSASEKRATALGEDARNWQSLGGEYLKEGIEFFRRANDATRRSDFAVGATEAIRSANLRPSPLAHSRVQSAFESETYTRSLRLIANSSANTSKSDNSLNVPYSTAMCNSPNRFAARETLFEPRSGRVASPEKLSALQSQIQHTSDFMATFNADIASILTRKSAVGGKAPSELDFHRKRPETAVGSRPTLDIASPKSRVHSSRLEEYLRKYNDGNASLMELPSQRGEPGGDLRARLEATRSAAKGILRYKNY